MSRRGNRRQLTHAERVEAMWRAQTRRAARVYQVGDPVRARRFVNIGQVGNPTIVAHPGDPGVVVAVQGASDKEGDRGLLAVRFATSDEPIDLTPWEIAPDWEEDDP
jgi:SLT domain-containing protein